MFLIAVLILLAKIAKRQRIFHVFESKVLFRVATIQKKPIRCVLGHHKTTTVISLETGLYVLLNCYDQVVSILYESHFVSHYVTKHGRRVA